MPDGDWYKDFGTFKLCGTGKLPSTFLMAGQPARGSRFETLSRRGAHAPTRCHWESGGQAPYPICNRRIGSNSASRPTSVCQQWVSFKGVWAGGDRFLPTTPRTEPRPGGVALATARLQNRRIRGHGPPAIARPQLYGFGEPDPALRSERAGRLVSGRMLVQQLQHIVRRGGLAQAGKNLLDAVTVLAGIPVGHGIHD